MIYCPGCGTANREGSRFCNECGLRLIPEETQACPRCGVNNPPGAAHCQECGYDLARARAEEPGPGAPPAGEEQLHPDAALPPWLDSTESEITPARSAMDELSELEAERQDGRPRPEGWSPELIPIEPVVGVPYRAYERAQLPPTAEQERAAKLFAAAAVEDAQAWPQEVPGAHKPSGLGSRQRRLLAATLLVVLLGPIVWRAAPLDAAPPAPAPVAAAAAAVEALPPAATVLVACEYDASVAGDLQPVAEAYLRHLLRRGARVLLVSTEPEGATLAGMVLDQASGEGTALNLGYVAGGDAAVRALASSVPMAVGAPGAQSLQGVGGATEMPLVVVLGRDLPALRRWIELAGLREGGRLLAGLPAQAGPAAEPYRASGQLQGVVAGVGDAAAYERLATGPEAARRMLGALRLGTWVLTATIVGANLWALVEWVRGRRVKRKT